MTKNRTSIFICDPSELAQVLGLSQTDAVAMEFRARLNRKIVELAKAQRVSHAAIAKAAGASRTRVTAILNGNTMGVSTDFLLRILYALGCKTVPTFSRIKRAA